MKTNYLTDFPQTDSLYHQKTKFIIIKLSKAKFELMFLNLIINGIPLERTGKWYKEENTNFLSVIFDELLTWKYHLIHINKNISKSLFAIKQVKNIFEYR